MQAVVWCVWLVIHSATSRPHLLYLSISFTSVYRAWGAGIAQWLERRTRDRKVSGSNPCWSGRRIFFSTVNFLCWLLFWYPFHPCVTAVARKRPRPFCQKCRWQVTAQRIHLTYVALHEVTWCMVVWCAQNAPRWQQFLVVPAMPALKYTTSVDIQKMCYKKLFTHVESHASAVSLLESGE